MSGPEISPPGPPSREPAATPTAQPPTGAPATGARAGRRRRGGSLLLLLLVLAAAGGGLFWWYHNRSDVYTDNAYVVGNITPISSEVTGQVVALFVDDNQIVQPGDPIAQVDPVGFQFQVDQALADYKQAAHDADAADIQTRYTTDDRKALLDGAEARRAEATDAVAAAEKGVQTRTQLHDKDEQLVASLQAQLPGRLALERNARDYYDRFKSLARSNDIPQQDFDNKEAAWRDAMAKVESLRSQITAAQRQETASKYQLEEAQILLQKSRKALANAVAAVGRAQAEQLQPDVARNTAVALRNKQRQAEARLRLAKLNLSNTLVRAPQAGIVSRRTIQLGQTVEEHKPFLSIVPLDPDNVWVVANLREEEMAHVRVGQAATVTVDGIPDRAFQGWVESVAGGTGSVFSLFPPDNATGNFVRVVQRLPVRIRFRPEEYEKRIRPGMSSRITIDTTRYERGSTQEW
jgi:membrane fusion protein (multidrug efflux system)